MSISTPIRTPLVAAMLVSLPCLAVPASGQERPLAITNARVLTIAGDPIERGTVVLRNGKITAVGKDIDVPAGAQVVDAAGGTVMPGLVSAYSRAGLTSARSAPQQTFSRQRGGGRRGRPSGGSAGGEAKNEAAKKVIDGLYARQDIFAELLRCGVTTLAVTPSGDGFPGRGAVLDPAGRTLEDLTVDDAAFVGVVAATGTSSKKLIREAFEKAKKIVEERNKKPEPPAPKKAEEKKPDAAKTEQKEGTEGEKKTEKKEEKPPVEKPPEKAGEQGKAAAKTEKKEEPKKTEKKKDPNLEVLADVLEGKARAFLVIDSANKLMHFLDCTAEAKFPAATLVVPSHNNNEGRIDDVLDKVKDWKAPILTTPTTTTDSYSRAVVNPAARIVAAGLEVGFLLGDSQGEVRDLFFKLMELERCGLSRDKALAAVTLVPAKALGLEERVGSIAEGRDADVLLWSGDPLDPTSRLLRIWHRGVEVDTKRPAAGESR